METEQQTPAPANGKKSVRLWRRQSSGSTVASLGQPMVWLAGGMLALSVVMIVALLLLTLVRGMATFWPSPIVSYHTVAGDVVTGEITRRSAYEPRPELIEALPQEAQQQARQLLADNDGISERVLIRTGNYELENNHFTWVSDFTVTEITYPEWFVVMERLTWGRFYGVPTEFQIDGQVVATDPHGVWKQFELHHGLSPSYRLGP